MPDIRPISDLRNHFTQLTADVQATNKPIFLTKNGCGAIVVMSMEAYEKGLYDSEVYDKLKEAEIQLLSTDERFSHEDVMNAAWKRLRDLQDGEGPTA